ncbi:DUF3710 domain-containing protein [Amnibacterium endophyticum]|uniref:DUF3710 domain-containing protein n=1 Tax=Amnibacterium endophyticum TaxID=2109337 RepID=A0ABW4LLB9_9MICO
MTDEDEAVEPREKSAPADRAQAGPLDEAEANPARPYIDLGGVRILPREGLGLRLEIEEGTGRVVALGLDVGDSSLQVQPFAAPRSSGLWHEIREQIEQQILSSGGTTRTVDGGLGPELLAQIPGQPGPDGRPVTRIARFVGVDGPRWFLRGVISGDAAIDPRLGAVMEELFRSVVVVRGSSPMPPRDLIPLQMPQGAEAEGPAPQRAQLDA